MDEDRQRFLQIRLRSLVYIVLCPKGFRQNNRFIQYAYLLWSCGCDQEQNTESEKHVRLCYLSRPQSSIISLKRLLILINARLTGVQEAENISKYSSKYGLYQNDKWLVILHFMLVDLPANKCDNLRTYRLSLIISARECSRCKVAKREIKNKLIFYLDCGDMGNISSLTLYVRWYVPKPM